jgi:hypothetical protein
MVSPLFQAEVFLELLLQPLADFLFSRASEGWWNACQAEL